MKVFIFDSAKCNGCYGCQLACKDEHCDNDWMPYAKPQPDTGHFWLKLNEKTHGSVPKVKLEFTPIPCMHCDNAACMQGNEDTVYKRADGLVIIDPEKAAGRKDLVDTCPYGAIYWNEELKIPQKCSGCAQLVDEGQLPHCVDVCATGAWRFGEEEEFADLIAQAEVLQPEKGLRPRVYYLNMPKLFIGGEVWDSRADEIVEGAEITLTCSATQEKQVTKTDDFGDFWFRKLSPGEYTICVRAKGYMDFTKSKIMLDKSLNIGPIAIKKMPVHKTIVPTDGENAVKS